MMFADHRGATLPRFVALLSVVAATVFVLGCGDLGAPGQGIDGDDGAVRGALAVYIADGPDGQSETYYALRSPTGAEQPLLFDHEPDLDPGVDLAVWGTASPQGLRVASFRVIAPSGEQKVSALLTGTPYAARSFAFVLVDLGQKFNPAITESDVLGRMINNVDSIRNYYINDSYGRQDITTQVFGPISYTLNGCMTNGNATGPGQLANDLRSMIPGTFQHYLWYFGSFQSACMWSGLASVGTPDKPSKDTWYNASTNCIVLVQEPGHNFGMQHSSSLTCPGASFADNLSACTASEYGDLFDPMGNGCRHMNAWQKTYQGWFGGCNGVAITASGTFTLLPFENRCDGAQFLKVKAPKARTFMRPAAGGGMATTETLAYYYVELRTPVDFDGMLGNRAALTPQVLIHAADDIHDRAQKGVHTYLLDMTPNTTGARAFTDAALPVGSTFTDPAGGVSITATAVSAMQATITVTITGGTGDPTCLDGTTFVAPGAGPESCAAAGGAGGAGNAGGTNATGGSTVTGGASGTAGLGGTGGRIGSGGATGTGGTTPGSGGGSTSVGGGSSGGSKGIGGAMPLGTGGVGSGAAIGNSGGGSGGTISVGTGGGPSMGPGGAPGQNLVDGGCQCFAGAAPLSWRGSVVSIGVLAAIGYHRRRRRRR